MSKQLCNPMSYFGKNPGPTSLLVSIALTGQLGPLLTAFHPILVA